MAHFRSVEGETDRTSGPRVRVESVREGGIAEKAGMGAGDLIFAAMNTERPTARDLAIQIRSAKGTPVRWKIRKPDGRELLAVMVPQAAGEIGAG